MIWLLQKVHISQVLNKLFLGQPLNHGSIIYIQKAFRRCKKFSKARDYRWKSRSISLRGKLLNTKPMSFIPVWLEEVLKCVYIFFLIYSSSQNIPQKRSAIWLALSQKTQWLEVLCKKDHYSRDLTGKTRTISVSLLQGLVVLEVQHCPVYTCKHLEERDILLHLSAIMRRLFSHKLRVKTTSHPHPHLSYLQKKICFPTCRNNFQLSVKIVSC